MFISYFFILFLTLLVGCDDSGNLFFETTLTLLNSAGQEITVFTSEESITLQLSIRNLTDSPQTLTLPSSQQYDFLIWKVLQNNTVLIIWRWSNEKGFLPMITELSLAPGEVKTFSETWNQTQNDGTSAGTGGFIAQGFIATSSEILNWSIDAPTQTRSPAVSFTINP